MVISLPNGQTLKAVESAILPIPQLPTRARQAHVVPGLKPGALVSLGTICDAECTANFTKDKVTIQYEGKVVLTGRRDPITRMWTIPIQKGKMDRTRTGAQQLNAVSILSQVKKQSTRELMLFYHKI